MAALGPLLGSFRNWGRKPPAEWLYTVVGARRVCVVPSVAPQPPPSGARPPPRVLRHLGLPLALLRAHHHPDVRHDDDGRVESPLS